VAAAAALAWCSPAFAQTWNDVTGNWNVAGNWTPSGVPTSNQNTVLSFGNTGTGFTSTNDLGAFALNRLNLGAAITTSTTIGGNALMFSSTTGAVAPQIVNSAAGAVSINNDITVSNAITFTGDGAGVLTFGGAWTNSGSTVTKTGTSAVVISNNFASSTLTVSGGTLTLNGATNNAGTSAQTSISAGATLNQNGANSSTGAVTVSGTLSIGGAGSYSGSSGTFTLGSAGLLELNNGTTNLGTRINDSRTVTSNGGRVNFVGSSAAASSETIGAYTAGSLQSTIDLSAGSGQSSTLRFASLTRTAGAALLVRGANLGTAAQNTADTSNLVFTTAPAVVGGGGATGTSLSIVPGLFGDVSTSGTGSTFVTYAGTGTSAQGARLLTDVEYTSTITSGEAAQNNVSLSAGASLTASSSTSVNSLRLRSGGGVTIGSGGLLTIGSGMVLATTGNTGISGSGTLAFGSREAILNSGADLTISAPITGTGGLTKTGTGKLTLSNASGMTGAVTVQSGTLAAGSAVTRVGGTAVSLSGSSSLDPDGKYLVTPLVAGGGSTSLAFANGGTLVVSGSTPASFSGSIPSSASIVKGGSGVWSLTSGTSFSSLVINGGTVYSDVAGGASTITLTADVVVNNGGTVQTGRSSGSGSVRGQLGGSLTINAGGSYTRSSAGTEVDYLGQTMPVTVNGGTINGSAVAGDRPDVFGTFTLGAGQAVVTLGGTNGGRLHANGDTLLSSGTGTGAGTGSTFARAGRGTMLVRGTSLGDIAANTATFSFNSTSTAGATTPESFEIGGNGVPNATTPSTQVPIIPFIVGDNSSSGTGSSFVTNIRSVATLSSGTWNYNGTSGTGFVNSRRGLVPLLDSEYASSVTASTNALDNVDLSAADVLAGAKAVNALRLRSTGALSGAGTLTVTSGAILAPSTYSGAGISVAALDFGNREAVFHTPGNLAVSSAITTTGGITKSSGGTLTLTGDLSGSSGGVRVNGGTLALGPTANLNGHTTIYVRQGGTLDVSSVSGGYTLVAGQTLGGSGAINGTLNLGAATLAPGESVGRLTTSASSSVVLGASSTLALEIGGLPEFPGVDFDQLALGASSTFNAGGAVLQLLPLSTVQLGQTYRVIDAAATGAAIAGVFAGLPSSGSYSRGDVVFSIDYGGSYVDITFSQVPEPGLMGFIGLAALTLGRRERKSSRLSA
jgi:autotransporter-associated beta strand protein